VGAFISTAHQNHGGRLGIRPARSKPSAVAEIGRLLVALYFGAMALGVNALVLLRQPEQYDGIADLAVLAP
jgi:hypothetical protein